MKIRSFYPYLDMPRIWLHYVLFSRFKIKPLPAGKARIIFSETRGGSTWLMELLQWKGVVTQWEPLNPLFGVIGTKLQFGDRPHLTKEEHMPELVSEFKQVMQGSRFSRWTIKYNKLTSLLQPRYILVKFVRANMLIDWLMNHMEFAVPPVFLIRHPVAVASSQLLTFVRKDEPVAPYEVPTCRNNRRYVENADYLNTLTTPLQRQVALWCINNLPVLNNQVLMKNMHVVYYEHLLRNPISILEGIARAWELELPQAEFDPRKKSKTSHQKGKEIAVEEQLMRWKKNLSENELAALQGVLDHYGCTLYSVHSPWPVLKE
jgi:hypothetical protein